MVAVLSYITLYSTLAMKQDHSTDSYKFCVFIGSFILKCDAQVETVQQLLDLCSGTGSPALGLCSP